MKLKRERVAGQVVAHKAELPLFPHSSAMVGSGSEAGGSAKAEGEAQCKAKGNAKTKAKAKATPKDEVQGGKEIDASPMWGEPWVKCPRSDEPQEDSEGSQVEGLAQAKAQAKAKATASRGTAGTFAGRRPPKCPKKRAKLNKLKHM